FGERHHQDRPGAHVLDALGAEEARVANEVARDHGLARLDGAPHEAPADAVLLGRDVALFEVLRDLPDVRAGLAHHQEAALGGGDVDRAGKKGLGRAGGGLFAEEEFGDLDEGAVEVHAWRHRTTGTVRAARRAPQKAPPHAIEALDGPAAGALRLKT